MNPTAAEEREGERGKRGGKERKKAGGGLEESVVRSVISCLVLY